MANNQDPSNVDDSDVKEEEIGSPPDPTGTYQIPSGATDLCSEAVNYFSQFPSDQFGPEHSFNPHVSRPTYVNQPSSALPLSSYKAEDRAHESSQPDVAQWSTQGFNPFVSGFVDEELNRNIAGGSVFEQGSILGESGRTYHSYKGDISGYLLPNDPAEQDRLDLQHAMMTYLWDGRLTLAPLPRAPRLVLDLCSGTGIWPLEFGRANPTSFVVGVDLSKIQPVPDVPNCLFERMDCEDDWMWSHRFDYIHIRMIAAAIRDPQRLIRQAFQYLNPGGWIEMGDAYADLLSEDGPDRDDRVEGSYLKRYYDACAAGAAVYGVDTHKAQHYKPWLEEAGFTEVKEEKFKAPCGPWPKDPKAKKVGQWMQANYLSGLRGVGYKMMRNAGMSPSEIDEFITSARDELTRSRIRGYTPWYAVYGRKPFDSEVATIGSLISSFYGVT
ncbi:uncharacterized protein JN550_011366 [Neoarthrinium moseri]|uniref:uncharacterized protein n=1 Tax=Neoarthrinium moseri TaxID=1658444 RepID=UPI001FDB597C|nr:uncharacterized protein JN550_011366 [Neoarthrinium moseri]KAI1860765.1 hypothetical protein JN550_011366 [Neoarthrinium moseri]